MADDKRPPTAEETYEPDLLELEDETGARFTFEVIDATDMDDQRYLALVPYDPDPAEALNQDAELVIMRVGELDGEEVLDVVEDTEELQMVGGVFLNRLEDLYEIELDEMEADAASNPKPN